MNDSPVQKEKRKTDFLEWFKAVGVVGGIAWAATVYFVERNDTQRIEARTRTLTQIDEFSKGGVSAAKKFVDDYWITEIPQVVRDAKTVNTSDLANTFKFAAKSNPEKYVKFTTDVAVIIDHLDYVTFCAQRGVCDAELVAAYYCKEVDALQSAMIPTLEEYDKRGIKSGANALKYFAENCEGATPAPKVAAAAN